MSPFLIPIFSQSIPSPTIAFVAKSIHALWVTEVLYRFIKSKIQTKRNAFKSPSICLIWFSIRLIIPYLHTPVRYWFIEPRGICNVFTNFILLNLGLGFFNSLIKYLNQKLLYFMWVDLVPYSGFFVKAL